MMTNSNSQILNLVELEEAMMNLRQQMEQERAKNALELKNAKEEVRRLGEALANTQAMVEREMRNNQHLTDQIIATTGKAKAENQILFSHLKSFEALLHASQEENERNRPVKRAYS